MAARRRHCGRRPIWLIGIVLRLRLHHAVEDGEQRHPDEHDDGASQRIAVARAGQ